MQNDRRIAVLGDGGWGTCLAKLLVEQGHGVALWGVFPEQIDQIRQDRENKKFLPGVALPESLKLTSDLNDLFDQTEVILVAVPSRYLRSVLEKSRSGPWDKALVISVVKGVEAETLLPMSELIKAAVPVKRLAVLSGPTIAYEVARGIPTTVVAASDDLKLAEEVQQLFNSDRFRVYTASDVMGVELGGALKNVIAIACGVADGLEFGANAKAALTTRGIVEMARLGAALGAKTETFSGLSGLGDLITTCFSLHSRNRKVGERLGRGESLEAITGGMEQVAEGITTAQSAYQLAQKKGIEMPITQAVYQMLYEGKSPKTVVEELMAREPKAE